MENVVSEEIKLKPCPFCGGNVHYSDGDNAHIVCFNPDCGLVDITMDGSFSDFTKLAKAWNTRHGDSNE